MPKDYIEAYKWLNIAIAFIAVMMPFEKDDGLSRK